MHSHSSAQREGRASPSPTRSLREAVRAGLKLAEVRLRIPLVLLISAVVVGRWDVIRNYWDKLTHVALRRSSAASPVSNDTEYFCPMDPGVVSDWPGKCGICNMALVRRKRGEAVALPDGIVARMQISPYRIQLAGIKTAPLYYRPLARSYEAAGIVRRLGDVASVPLEIPARSARWMMEGHAVTVRGKDLADPQPMAGLLHFENGARAKQEGGAYVKATITIDDQANRLPSGMVVDLTLEVPVAQLEPFRSLPTEPPPWKPGEPRLIFACPDHPDAAATAPGRCPIDRNPLEGSPLAEHQRVRWWCPMHPAVTADHAGASCRECNGMVLEPRLVSFQPAGKVLAVPESAVVDTGLRKVVFVATMPGTFDGVEVELGPRCGGFYPVIRGAQAGQQVAVAGAFLLDAETRLNPSLAASYFGATGRDIPASAPRSAAIAGPREDPSPLGRLATPDRGLAERQKSCPVTGKALGSMGTPTRVVVAGRVVFLCCEGCEDALRSEPAKYLAKLPAESRP
jgi:hypothetical protein